MGSGRFLLGSVVHPTKPVSEFAHGRISKYGWYLLSNWSNMGMGLDSQLCGISLIQNAICKDFFWMKKYIYIFKTVIFEYIKTNVLRGLLVLQIFFILQKDLPVRS